MSVNSERSQTDLEHIGCSFNVIQSLVASAGKWLSPRRCVELPARMARHHPAALRLVPNRGGRAILFLYHATLPARLLR